MDALRLTGVVRHVVPSTTTTDGRRKGGFGFIRCDGVHSGQLRDGEPVPTGVDHFVHVRDTRVGDIRELADQRVTFIPVPPPAPEKNPGAIEVEVLP